MIILNNPQGSDEWLNDRIAVLSGTRISKIVTPVKMELAKGFEKTLHDILDEDITGIQDQKNFSTEATERGNSLEPFARKAYIEHTGINIIETGLCLSDKNKQHGCSPDGWAEDFTGATEIKCLGSKHGKVIQENKIPSDHILQVTNYFLVNEKLEWLDYVLYRPEYFYKPLHIIRVTREELQPKIEKVGSAVDLFFSEYEKIKRKVMF